MSETTVLKNDEIALEEKYQELRDYIHENKEKKGYLIPVLLKHNLVWLPARQSQNL